MSHMLELPDQVYDEMRDKADALGLTPLGWLVSHLPSPNGANGSRTVEKPTTMADRLAGRIGRISSGSGRPNSDGVARSFAESLEEKQREGRL
jgi:hypothetical protein